MLLVKRTEVVRLVDAREAAREQRVTKWRPMTERGRKEPPDAKS